MGPVCADTTARSPRGVKEDVAYRVKNTFVEIGPMPKDEFSYLRNRRSRSEATELLKVPSPQLAPARAPAATSQEASFVPDTPSPVLRPAPPEGAEVPPLNEGYGMNGEEEMCLPPAYMGEDAMMLAGMGYEEMGYYGVPTIMYDPVSGCGWPMCMPIDMSQAHMGEDMAQCEMVTMDGQVLMDAGDVAASGDVDAMWAQDPGTMEALCCNMEAESAMMPDESMAWAMPEPQQEDGQQEWATEARTAEQKEGSENKEWGEKETDGPSSWEESRTARHSRKNWRDTDGHWDDSYRHKDDSNSSWDNWDYGWRKGARSSRRSQRQADAWNDDWSRWSHREERSEPAQVVQEEATPPAASEEPQAEGSTTASSSSDSPGAQAGPGDSGYTTVMLRNIPNKYTREMLVKQLNQDFKGRFDFVYLPIDFKNKCNVGYGFINFRTSAACDEFIAKYDGVDVRKCLPGLNSKKVAGVTPARVQGLEENVRRLRTGPVMNELVNHPEWMPLLLNDNGEAVPFPMPDHPAPAAKLKRRARDEVGGRGGW
mmetsp:Transcript_34989/g.80564  ORF Transcript_34989/g.80564 Transcript_34989/m.80564 type:complete len:540 (+) Transcript_34989:74-1693(+)